MEEPFCEIRFTLPAEWRDELKTVAELQAISLADLLRLIVRGFLRNRYSDLEREVINR